MEEQKDRMRGSGMNVGGNIPRPPTGNSSQQFEPSRPFGSFGPQQPGSQFEPQQNNNPFEQQTTNFNQQQNLNNNVYEQQTIPHMEQHNQQQTTNFNQQQNSTINSQPNTNFNRQTTNNLESSNYQQQTINYNSQVSNSETINNQQQNPINSVNQISQQQNTNTVNTGANVQVSNTTTQTATTPVNTITPPQVTISQANVQTNVTQPVQATTNTQTQPVEVKPQPKVSNTVIIPVSTLQHLVNQVKLVTGANTTEVLGNVFYIEVNKNGIIMKATNKAQTIEVKDSSVSYTVEFATAVNATKFGGLVSNLEEGQVELIYDKEQRALTLTTGTGRFSFAEQIDLSTGQTITVEHQYEAKENELVPFNLDALLNVVNQSKPVRMFAKNMPDDKPQDAIYLKNGSLVSYDSGFVLVAEAPAEFKNTDIALGSAFLDILPSLTFNKDNVKFSIVNVSKDTNSTIQGIVVTDGVITISSTFYSSINEDKWERCAPYLDVNYGISYTLDVQKCLRVLDRVAPFIEMGTDADSVQYTFKGNQLEIKSLTSAGVDMLLIDNPLNYFTTIKLPVQRVQKLLSVVQEPTFKITVSTEVSTVVCFSFGTYKCIVATSKDNNY